MRALQWIVMGIVLLVTGAAVAQEAAPVLRIETGAHEAYIRDGATDAAGRVLVTASDDRTARIWSLPDLRPLGVLRPAVGSGNEGKLYAVAVSPDGTLAAIGGWTTPENDQAVLVFDLVRQRVVRRLAGLPNVVHSLAFSQDGTRLAAGLYGANGIRVWDTAAWQQSFADKDFSDVVHGLAFARDGRLAAGSYDGSVRLYDRDGLLLARTSTQAGHHPVMMAFSPDSGLLAIGFQDVQAIEVRNGASLVLRSRPDMASLTGNSMQAIAWSNDGRTLFGGTNGVYAWSDRGAGPRRIVNPGVFHAKSLCPLPGGRLTVISADNLAVLDANGRSVAERNSRRQDLNTTIQTNVSRRFLIARDGTQVAWVPLGALGTAMPWRRFDAISVDLSILAKVPSGLVDWAAMAGPLTVTDWDDNTAPKLSGRPLLLKRHEASTSVALVSGQTLLGAEFTLRLFDADAAQQWEMPVPSVAWRVNQSADGRLAVAALGDGTVRWYRIDNGKELLSLFATADGTRWVAWTPSGYYAASLGGEDLIGWHVNNGIDKAASFFAAGQFRERFYRPDVVQRLLATLDETEALRQADAARGTQTRPAPAIIQDLPPIITILSPADGTQATGNTVTLEYSLRSPSGKPVRAVRARVDGQLADGARGLDRMPSLSGSGEARGQIIVDIPQGGTVEVSLVAETETRSSEPAHIRLRGAAPVRAPDPLLPRLNVVAIGISEYNQTELRTGVRFAAKDARDFANALAIQRQRGLYREVNIRVVTDAQATRAGVMGALNWLYTANTTNDTALVFLASHGMPDEEGMVFALPVDADMDQISVNGISQTELRYRLSRIHGRVVAFLDLCHAGGAVFASRGLPDITPLLNQLSEPGSGVIVFAAAQARQAARELTELGNGAFTRALLDGIAGAADLNHDGAIRTDELNVYIADRVRALVGGTQHPSMQRHGDIPDFPLFVVPK